MARLPGQARDRAPARPRGRDGRAAPRSRPRDGVGGLAQLAAAREEHRGRGAVPIEYRRMRGVERQSQIYVGGVSGRRPRVPVDFAELERRAEAAMSEKAFAYVAAGSRARGDDPCEPRRVHGAGRSSRGCSATSPSATRVSSSSAAASPTRSCSRRSASSSSRTATRSGPWRPRPPRTGIPMIFSNQASTPMEEVAALLGRQPALVPALLERLRRPGREPRQPRGGVRVRGDRRHARHHRARLADARPRARVPALPARQGDRAVHERPGLPAADRRGAAARRCPERRRARARLPSARSSS